MLAMAEVTGCCLCAVGLFGFEGLAAASASVGSLLGGLAFDLSIAGDALLVLGIGLGKDVTIARRCASGDEVEVVVAIGIGDGAQRLDAGIGDGVEGRPSI